MAGAIFDSCPADLHLSIAVKAMYYSNAFPNPLAFCFVTVILSVFYAFMYAKKLLGFKEKNMYEVRKF